MGVGGGWGRRSGAAAAGGLGGVVAVYHTDQSDQKFRGGAGRGGEMAIQSPLAGCPVLQTVGIRLGKISPKKLL